MLIVREVFTAKPGQASKLAAMFKKAMPQLRIMTDVVGPYNTVVCEMEVKSLADFERQMEEWRSGKGNKKEESAMKGYAEMYLTGRREIYRVE